MQLMVLVLVLVLIICWMRFKTLQTNLLLKENVAVVLVPIMVSWTTAGELLLTTLDAHRNRLQKSNRVIHPYYV